MSTLELNVVCVTVSIDVIQIWIKTPTPFSFIKKQYFKLVVALEMEHEGTVKKAFTFVWKIENMHQAFIRPIRSPEFTVEELNKTEWHLELHPGRYFRNEYLACRLQRNDSNEPESADISFEISLVLADGSSKKESSKYSFCKGDFYSYDELALRASVFEDSSADIEIRCSIWACDEEYSGTVNCFARTRFAKKNRSFKWVIEDLSSLSVDTCSSFSLGKNEPEVTLKLFLSNGTYRVRGLEIKASGVDYKKVMMVRFQVSALDAKEKVIWSEAYFLQILVDRSIYTWSWPLYITPEDLITIYGLNSSENVWTLKCQCSIYFIQMNKLEELLTTN